MKKTKTVRPAEPLLKIGRRRPLKRDAIDLLGKVLTELKRSADGDTTTSKELSGDRDTIVRRILNIRV